MSDSGFRSAVTKYSSCWDDNSQEKAASENLLNHLITQPFYNLSHITFTALKRIMKQDLEDHQILQIALGLVARSDLLELRYEYIDDEIRVDVDPTVVFEAGKTGEFYHPETEELVKDYKQNLFLYFRYSEKLRELRSKMEDA